MLAAATHADTSGAPWPGGGATRYRFAGFFGLSCASAPDFISRHSSSGLAIVAANTMPNATRKATAGCAVQPGTLSMPRRSGAV